MANISKTSPVAYFCAEYGIKNEWPVYAGGLGVLAGDTVKQSADSDFPLVAVGLIYRGCDGQQYVDESGMQHERDIPFEPQDEGFEQVMIPNTTQPLHVRVHLSVQDVWARVWKATIGGKTDLYLLDTDTTENHPDQRDITCTLYGGGDDFLLKQQMLLGIGGVKVLHALGIFPSVYHVNEGRPAFLFWQLTRHYMDEGKLDFAQASEKAKETIVYTNHTLVRAGNNSLNIDSLKNYASYYADKMKVSIDRLLDPGMDKENGVFSMTQFALNTSKKASGVSKIHYDLSREIWPEYNWSPITNGVHMPTWQRGSIQSCDMQQSELWWEHLKLKREMADFVFEKTGYGYDSERLVIVWARRIASYKRPDALFTDIERLTDILRSTNKPVQLILTGKAHASDTEAKKMLQTIIGYMQHELSGNALYIPGYDMSIAKYLVSGADLWLNTPIFGQEASGTSGMKAIANGVLQLTVEDGWAAEVDWDGVGWTLDSDQIDTSIYSQLEDSIVPEFYARNEQGCSKIMA